MSERLQALQELAKIDPKNLLVRYGIAMELKKAGDSAAAIREFEAVLEINPNYGAAYFHGGQTFEEMGDVEGAKAIYQRGIEATTRSGDAHTRSELQGALDLLP